MTNLIESIDGQKIMIILAIIGVAIVLCFLVKTVKRIIAVCLSALFMITMTGTTWNPRGIVQNTVSDVTGTVIDQIKDNIAGIQSTQNGVVGTQQENALSVFDEIKIALGGLQKDNLQSVPDAPAVNGNQVLVHYIDVGQADCELIEDNGHYMLIDCGNAKDDGVVLDYLYGLGVEKLDYFVGTHPHEDHIGCAASILRNIDCDNVILSPADNTTVCYNKMIEESKAQACNEIRVTEDIVGDTFDLGNGKFQLLGPISIDAEELNNDSVVIRYIYGDTSFLFQGDAEREEEQEILEAGYTINSTVYKVGHHGSDSSTSYPWLREMSPKVAIIPVGEGNDYGHPTEGTLSKLSDANVDVYRTDLNGTIVITSDGLNISVDTEKGT